MTTKLAAKKKKKKKNLVTDTKSNSTVSMLSIYDTCNLVTF